MQPSLPSPPPGRAWRAVQYPPVALIIGVAIVAAAGALYQATIVRGVNLLGPQGSALHVLVTAGGAAALVAGYRLFNRWIEHRPNVEFALPGAGRELGAGIVAGVLLFSTVVAVQALAGGYRIASWNGPAILLPALSLGILSAVLEETVMRGLVFRLLEQWLGSWPALAISAALFGLGHLGNQHSGWLPVTAIALEAGIMLAALYMLTRRLWAAIGLHGAWNFAQGGIYGINVSGIDERGLIRPHIAGPDWLTGGAFGAEASLPAIVIATGFGVALLVRCVRRDRIVPLLPRRGSAISA